MMVGHSLLAFALVALAASYYGYTDRRALLVGGVAGVLAAVPDVDMAYALVGVTRSSFDSVWSVTGSFWESSTVTHRAVTHSLVISTIAGTAFALSTMKSKKAIGACALILSTLTLVVLSTSGTLNAAMIVLFSIAGVTVAVLSVHRLGLTPREFAVAGFVGLLSHPFGDIFTGTPPEFFYPLDISILTERIVLSSDPTLNLVSIFLVEVAVIWFAAFVFLRLTHRNFVNHINKRAVVGVGYAGAFFVLPAPTLDVSYHFVFSVLALGFVNVDRVTPGSKSDFITRFELDGRLQRVMPEPDDVLTASLTGLGAVTLGILTYTVVYVVQTLV